MRQSIHLHIDPSPYANPKVNVATHTPSPSLNSSMSTRSDADNYYGTYSGPSDTDALFSVLCKYDFSSDEDGLLPFRKGEILEIVKRDNTGWWAAMRREGPVVGWIPQAFVVQLSNEMADKLRNTREECRVYEYEAEQLYNSAPVSRIPALFDTDSTVSSPLPQYEAYRTNTPLTASHNTRHDQNNNLYFKSNTLRPANRPAAPPSPTSPMPHPPLTLPEKKSKPNLVHSGMAEANRSQSAPLTNKRSIRARGMILENNPVLSRTHELKSSQDIERVCTPDIIQPGTPTRIKLKRQASIYAGPIETVIHIRPWYLQPQLNDQIEADAKGHIRSATLLALIERLTTHDAPVDLTEQAELNAFTNVFLATFRTFTTANNFLEILTERYNARPPQNLSENEYEDWKESWREPTRKRILDIFNIWLEDHRLLEEEPHLARPLTEYLRTITEPPHNVHANAIIKTLERLTFTLPTDPSKQTTPKKPRKSKAHKGDLLKLDPVDLAEQLALWEQALYVKVTPQECLSYAKTQSGPEVAGLYAFCSTHDNLVAWVKASILNHEILGKRSDTVDFWIKVAEKCRLLNNIASMSAIIIALSSADITRLHLTWAHVNRKASLETLLRYNEPTGGFAGYRSILQNAEGPCVPFITMYLTDIIHTQDSFAYQDIDGRVCFYKRARWYEIVNNILKFQKRKYNIAPNETSKQFIEGQLAIASSRDQNWFWSKSQEVQHSELAHADIRKGLERAGF
ncbi:ras GEF [Pholiota conissans]|uniref:Ras GEF n=1 Tax=Pholiota conissans TaxID=109636 RepID=A0A9P6D830_9AGAR|nr:ras GEF [Pholiota conissans]